MTHKELFDALAGTMTRANNEVSEIINRLSNDVYHLGCIAGEEDADRSKPKTQLDKILHAMYLDYPDTAAYTANVTIKTSDKILYNGPANEVPEDIKSKTWIIVSIFPDMSKLYEDMPVYNVPKIIEVI